MPKVRCGTDIDSRTRDLPVVKQYQSLMTALLVPIFKVNSEQTPGNVGVP